MNDYGGSIAITTLEMHGATYNNKDVAIAEWNFANCGREVKRLQKTSSMEKFLKVAATVFKALGCVKIHESVSNQVLKLSISRNKKMKAAQNDLQVISNLLEKIGGSLFAPL